MTKIKDFVILSTSSIYPKENIVYNLYSLPAFDNEQKCEILRGKDIQSNKYIVPDKCILFNKLSVRFKRVWRIDSLEEHKLCSTEFLPLIIDETKVDYQYFFYLLISDSITNYLCGQNANTSGSHKRISPADLLEIPVKLPSMPEQKAIGKILSDIDRKIALNKAINHNLVAMAKQLYDYWFVQFDFPNEDGKPYKSSGGKMVWNEKLKREIPEGWEMKELGELIIGYQQGLIRSNQQLSNLYDYPYLKMGDLNGEGMYSSLNIAKTNATPREVEQYSLKKGDFLINVRNSREIVGKTCVIDYVEKNTLYNHMLVRLVFVPNISSYYMNILFNTYYMNRLLDGLKQGTTTVIALYREDLNRIPIIVATNDIMLKFKTFCSSILDKKENIAKQLSFLTKQREELLPLLMNGQVTVG